MLHSHLKPTNTQQIHYTDITCVDRQKCSILSNFLMQEEILSSLPLSFSPPKIFCQTLKLKVIIELGCC